MPPLVETNLRAMMASHVGVVRDGDAAGGSTADVRAIERDTGNIALRNMATTALLVAAAAWARRESRGAHYRSDYPGEKPALAHRTMTTLGGGARDRSIACRARSHRDARAADDRLNCHDHIVTLRLLLHPDAFLSPLAIDEAVQRALDEDLGRAGDITSIATIPEATHAHAIVVARQAGVIAGLPLAVATFQKLSPDISIDAHIRDGGDCRRGRALLTIAGRRARCWPASARR